MTVNIGDLLTRRAHLDPDKEGLVETASGRRFSYRELNLRANRVTNGLHGLDLAPGDRVGLLLMNSIEFVESFFAVGKAGGVIVPLNWRLVADELEFILSDSGTSVLIFGSEFAEPTSCSAQEYLSLIPHTVKLTHTPDSRHASSISL